ncbi:MAG: rhodanese-like domain-containing protein [Alphaproteobacteria bacterium]|nr:rhodanese-like domain-containing protein [Alphaproteobacteria bacterium]
MRRWLAAFLLAFPFAAQAEPAPPVVDVAWLQDRLCDGTVITLDLRRSQQNFAAEHIPCSVHSDYYGDGWRASRDGVDNMVPPVERLERLIGSLGIGNANHVVLATAALDMFSAAELARVYFIFRYLGHDAVSILDGGLGAWTAEWDNDVEIGDVTTTPTTFTAQPRTDMIADRAEVEAAFAADVTLVDMRNNDHYLGINSTRVVLRPGTIPGAINLPMTWLLVNEGLRFRTPAQLRTLWAAAGIDPERRHILFCNSGLESAVGWLALGAQLGNAHVKLYDGSLAEWSADPSLPMTLTVPLD